MMVKNIRFFSPLILWLQALWLRGRSQGILLLKPGRSRRVSFGAMAVLTAFVCVTLIAPVRAVPLGDILLRSIQVIQISNISERQEVQLGAQMHTNLLRQGTRVSGDTVLNRYVTDVGLRLSEAGDRKIPYRFHVVEDKAVNAFATMGGYVYVTTGLMRAADNEAQLASVIGHEIGHIEKRHLIAQIRQSMIARGLVASTLGQSQLANIGVDLLVSRPASRQDEYEADQVGLRLLRDATYATSAMPAFMQKLVRGGSSPTILSSHPAVPARLRALEKAIASGMRNRCNEDGSAQICGLDEQAYASQVKQRLLI